MDELRKDQDGSSSPSAEQIPPHVLLVRQPDGNVQVKTNMGYAEATWMLTIGQAVMAQQGLPQPPVIQPPNGHGMREALRRMGIK